MVHALEAATIIRSWERTSGGNKLGFTLFRKSSIHRQCGCPLLACIFSSSFGVKMLAWVQGSGWFSLRTLRPGIFT